MSGVTCDECNNLLQVNDEDGEPITVACEYHTGDDPLSSDDVVAVEQFYDLVYQCDGEKEAAASHVASQLLMEAAVLWNLLPNGEACTNPVKPYSAWLFGVSSEGPDTFVSDFGCQRLTPNSTLKECCMVVRSEMSFIPSGGYNKTNLERFMQDRLGLQAPQYDYDYAIHTISIVPPFADILPVDDPRGNLGEPNRTGVAGAMAGQASLRSEDNKITVTGGFVIALLCAAFAGVVFVMFLRSRKANNRSRGLTMDKDDGNSTMGDRPSNEDDFHVTVIPDDALPGSPFPPPLQQLPLQQQFVADSGDFGSEELEDQLPAKYAFDLSQSFKNDVMGAYYDKAPTTMPVVAPYPLLEDTSCDSEVDSWAQTDGTVGSLEERLEEITAEI